MQTHIDLATLKALLGPPCALHSDNPHVSQGTPLSHLYIDYGPAQAPRAAGFPRLSERPPLEVFRHRRRRALWEAKVRAMAPERVDHDYDSNNKSTDSMHGLTCPSGVCFAPTDLGHGAEALRAEKAPTEALQAPQETASPAVVLAFTDDCGEAEDVRTYSPVRFG